MQMFKDFNDAIIADLPPSTLEEEQDVAMTILYWVLFIIMWAAMFVADIWDMAVFILYCIFDFSSAWEIFVQDELTPWAYYAMAAFAYGLFHGAYVVGMIILTIVEMYASDYQYTADDAGISMYNQEYFGVFFWIYIVVNTGAIAIPTSKLIWIFVENEEEENGFF